MISDKVNAKFVIILVKLVTQLIVSHVLNYQIDHHLLFVIVIKDITNISRKLIVENVTLLVKHA